MRRDSQKSKLYTAESTLPEMWGAEHRLPTLEACQRFVDSVMARSRVRARWPFVVTARRVEVRQWRGGGARAQMHSIRVNVGKSSTKMILLHELAHVLDARAGDNGHQAHGWQYAEVYLWLVREVMGLDVWSRLKAAFDGKTVKLRGRVRYRAPRRLSGAQRAAALANLQQARAATRRPRES